jgi:hypothetical protein
MAGNAVQRNAGRPVCDYSASYACKWDYTGHTQRTEKALIPAEQQINQTIFALCVMRSDNQYEKLYF